MQLTHEEHTRAEIGDDSVFLAEETPTSFIVAGLDIEEAQYDTISIAVSSVDRL